MKKVVFLLATVVLLGAWGTPAVAGERDLGRHFADYGVQGSFLLYDLRADTYIWNDRARCSERFIPASTFKIVNALIALETGVAPDAGYIIPWDGKTRGIPAWNQDHTLQSAFAASTVWYYQELARRIGPERMQHYLDLIGYGNGDITGGIDQFWLTGGLRISPQEQIALLVRLYRGQLPVSARSQEIVKTIMVQREGEGYVLRGKTGWARLDRDIGWYVGYVEKGADVYFFAVNIESGLADKDFIRARTEIAERILRELGII